MKRTVLITGASSGIGEASARYFWERGWNVAATMRRPEESSLQGLENLSCIKLDVTSNVDIKRALDETIERFGSLQVVVNNAGYAVHGIFEASKESEVREQFDVNVFGVMNLTRAVLPYLRERREGIIINVTSLAGVAGFPLGSIYDSTKWAIEGFTEALSYELEPFNVLVKLVEPGSVRSRFLQNAVVTGHESLGVYDEFVAAIHSKMKQRHRKQNSPEQIAEVIYRAAVDGKDRLRYLAGKDARLGKRLRRVLSYGMFNRLVKKLAT